MKKLLSSLFKVNITVLLNPITNVYYCAQIIDQGSLIEIYIHCCKVV